MKVVTNYQWPEEPFRRSNRLFGNERPQLVAFDVEWTKNYQIKNGSRPFCYSIVTLPIPEGDQHRLTDLAVFFFYKCVYVDDATEEQALIRGADEDLASVLEPELHTIAGHQLTSDLSVLKSASVNPTPAIERVIQIWHGRRESELPSLVDTRYDIDEIVGCQSRRLVDVCNDLGIEVQQPEIRGSMTKVHRQFLDSGKEISREKLMVLNLRHSLSTGLIALIAMGVVQAESIDVNDLLIDELWDQMGYIHDGHLASALASA